MTPRRQLVYLATVTLALVAIVKAAQISLTFDILPVLRAIAGNVVVQALGITVGFVWLISLCVLAWERAERRHAEWCARMEAAARWETDRRRDTSSLADDSPDQTDCGPRAA